MRRFLGNFVQKRIGMSSTLYKLVVEELHNHVSPIYKTHHIARDYEVVMIGEETHGTREFYEYRCNLTKKLIEDGLCMGVCIEGDWPDTAALHRFVTHMTTEGVDHAMSGFARFPTWMWRNHSIKKFVLWLREHNRHLKPEQRCGIFGIDLYSLHLSMQAVINYLEMTDPESAAAVEEFYSCFDKFGINPQDYGLLTTGVSGAMSKKSCQAEVAEAFREVCQRARLGLTMDSDISARDEAFICKVCI